MKNRTVQIYTDLQHFNVGPFKVKQPLPNSTLNGVDPFLLLHHAGPTQHAPGEIKARLGAHPHRGFEPVTFLFGGKIHHKDSTGSEGFLETGDVQWMTSGSGIIHSEGPSADFAKEGGTMELIQLWVNLPAQHKMTPPKYQDVKAASMPVVKENGFEFRVVAGEYKNAKGPASTFTAINAIMLWFDAGAETILELPPTHNALLYILEGTVNINEQPAVSNNIAVFEGDEKTVAIKAATKGRALLLTGEPINEPVASYGPFVMNYQGEIKQAMLDYQAGKMGVLEA